MRKYYFSLYGNLYEGLRETSITAYQRTENDRKRIMLRDSLKNMKDKQSDWDKAEVTSGGYKVQFHGFYYDPGAAPKDAYVVRNDKMYHLSSAWNNFMGTSWYVTITDAQGNAKALSFSFDGDSSTTAIENVIGQENAAVPTDGHVYNLSGLRMGTRNNMSNLSAGIYVVAGKKFVVK